MCVCLVFVLSHIRTLGPAVYFSPWLVVSDCCTIPRWVVINIALISSCICWWVFILFAWEKDFLEFKIILKHFIPLYHILVLHLYCGVIPMICLGTFLIDFCVFCIITAYKNLLPVSTPHPLFFQYHKFYLLCCVLYYLHWWFFYFFKTKFCSRYKCIWYLIPTLQVCIIF